METTTEPLQLSQCEAQSGVAVAGTRAGTSEAGLVKARARRCCTSVSF